MFKITIASLCAALTAAVDGSEFVGRQYIEQDRHAKSEQIWFRVTEDRESGGWFGLAKALMVDENTVFDNAGDEMPCTNGSCRPKTIHGKGVVGQINWKSFGNHPYTGMFKGADAGYVRLSVAAPVDFISPNLKPGMGVKLLRDKMDSANFVAMYSVDG